MDPWTLGIFLCGALFGSYVQSVTGFAMAMILVAVASGAGNSRVSVVAAVVSLLSLVNVALALRGHLERVDRRLFLWLAVGQLPAIGVGIVLLDVMEGQAVRMLEIVLGVFIVLGSLSMMLRPHPKRSVSAPWACVVAGMTGGLAGGLFAASGPVMGWFNYRQPLPVAAIRATLLCGFAMTTSVRTTLVAVDGGLTREVWLLTTLALPMVVLGTWAGRTFEPPVSELAMKRLAFAVLLVMGIWILLRAGLR